MKLDRYLIIPFTLCICIAIIYSFTSAPFMLWLDSLDFVAASTTLGINNPPTPIYVLLAHLFTYLPFVSVIFRLQVFSVLTAAGTLFLLYHIIISVLNQITKEKDKVKNSKTIPFFAATFGVMALAFSYVFWTQSQNVERFLLICFIELLVFSLLTGAFLKRNFLYTMLGIVIILGIATGTDPIIMCFFPSVLLVLWKNKHELSLKKFLLLCGIGLLTILLVYSYLPLAAAHNPFLNYGRPTTLTSIWEVATGHGLNVYNPELGYVNGFTGSAAVFLTSFGHYFEIVWLSFTPFLLPFILCGMCYLWARNKLLFGIFILPVFSNLLLSSFYLSGNQESWYLLSHVIFAFFAGIGYVWILNKLRRLYHAKVISLVLFLFAFAPLLYWWQTLDRRDWNITNDYIENLYRPIDEPAILFGGSDLFINASYYVHDATTYKQQVIPVIDTELYLIKSYRENLKKTTPITIPDDEKLTQETPEEYSKYINDFFAMNLPRYKIYINYSALSSNFFLTPDGTPNLKIDTKRFKLIPAGLVQEVVLKDSKQSPNINDYNYHFSNNFPRNKPFMLERGYNIQLKGMISEYVASYNTLGAYLMQKDEIKKASSYFHQAYDMDNKNAFTIYNLALINGREGKIEKEKELLKMAIDYAEPNSALQKNSQKIRDSLERYNEPTQNEWKTFEDKTLNVTFMYPSKVEVRSFGTNQYGLFDLKNLKKPIMTIYSEKSNQTVNLDTFGKQFPYPVSGKLSQNKLVTLPGFKEAKMQLYTSGDQQTELFLLKTETQIIAVTIPLDEMTNNDAFVTTLNKIIKSIKILN